MKHLDFIVWMVAFPLSQAIIDAIRWRYCERNEYSEAAKGLAALILMTMWLGIGALLW